MGKVLVIDDDELHSEMLSDMIGNMGHTVALAFTAEAGLREAGAKEYDIVFLDVQLPDGNGLELLPEIQAAPSAPEVIIITGFGSPDGAELAIKNGAWDFIEKPFRQKMIELPLTRALQYRESKKRAREPLVLKREEIIGDSPIMNACLERVARAAASDAPVIITGETGTGKELFARAVHNNSSRSGNVFVTVDCASLPSTIIESILFGHEKGAFTGADRSRDGLIRQADGGTLFLDEIGELPFPIQKTFLRVLQERNFRPVGGSREIASDFRLIAATNRNLKKMVSEGTFREDLLFRLQAFTIELPSLKNRPAYIRKLCFHYVNKLCDLYRKEPKGYSPEFMDALCAYAWPGNVREMINALENAVAVADADPILFPKHLPEHIRIHMAREAIQKKTPLSEPLGVMGTLKERREKVLAAEERIYLQELMAATGGDISRASGISGLSRVRLYVLLKQYNIKRTDRSVVS
jgi:two-component system NtrC family response regulator